MQDITFISWPVRGNFYTQKFLRNLFSHEKRRKREKESEIERTGHELQLFPYKKILTERTPTLVLFRFVRVRYRH